MKATYICVKCGNIFTHSGCKCGARCKKCGSKKIKLHDTKA